MIKAKELRRFKLVRSEDITGVSGTGVVAQGVQFEDGTVAMRWLSSSPSTSVYNSIIDVQNIHGHGGTTVVEWIDHKEGVTIASQRSTASV